MKVVKVKNMEKIIKAAREKELVMCKGKPHKAIRFFSRNFIGQKGVANIFKVLKKKKSLTKIPYLACLSLRIEGKINSFPDKQKLKELIFSENGITRNIKGTFFKLENVLVNNKKTYKIKNFHWKGRYIIKVFS